METRKQVFFQGARDILPILLGVVPFSMIAGIAAIKVGFSHLEALAMSVIVFAGVAQLAAIDLIGQQAPLAVIVLTALIINLRFSMYSASLAPHFRDQPLTMRTLFAYLLTDQAFALSITAFRGNRQRYKQWYYLGVAITMWFSWQVGTATGVFLGARIPKSWGLEFAVPLTFLALIFPAIKDTPAKLAAATAGILALACPSLPYNLELYISVTGGIFVGFFSERWRRP